MRHALVLVLLISSRCFSQTPPTKGQANANEPCTIANTGNDNKISINCGISKQQGQKMLAILNKILANQLDPSAVMSKLDEILHAVNPNLSTKAYFCNGGWRTAGVGPNVGMEVIVNSDPDSSFAEMLNLANAHNQYEKLLKVCTLQIESNPEWLTPRLFCALAYANSGNTAKAKEMLEVYDARKGPAYDGDATCKQISDFLHANLK